LDTLPQTVAEPLQILIYISIVLLLIIGIFLIKLLLDTSNLVNSLQDFIKVTHAELEPAIKEINGTLSNINNISSSVNNQLNSLNVGLEKGGRILSESGDKAYKQLKVAGDYAKEGLFAVIKAFLKK